MYTIKITSPGHISPWGDDRRDWIYAELYNPKGELSISATLEYVLVAVKEGHLEVSNLLDVLIEVEKHYSEHRSLFI